MEVNPVMVDVLKALSKQVITRPGPRFPGKLAQVWAKFQKDVQATVKREQLQPVKLMAGREKVVDLSGLIWWNPAGGWPLPHFHLGEDIYAVTQPQWQQFSATVMAKVGPQLQAAKVVGFEETLQITEAAAQVKAL